MTMYPILSYSPTCCNCLQFFSYSGARPSPHWTSPIGPIVHSTLPHILGRMPACSAFKLRHIATDVARSVVCMSVCVGHTGELCKIAESIEMPFGGLTYVGPRNHVLDGVQYRTNPFAAVRGDKSAMRGFAKLLWILVRRT